MVNIIIENASSQSSDPETVHILSKQISPLSVDPRYAVTFFFGFVTADEISSLLEE
jgi:hypothetical protein